MYGKPKKRGMLAIAALCVAALACFMLAGCSGGSSAQSTQQSDQAKADQVAQKIDDIYVQERTENTDAQCAEAKAAWDELSDAQKELVSGEHASPEYFGLDTGDASADDPLNQDGIGQNEILVASFGTSYNDSRTADIGGIEKAIQEAYPDWSVRRAFTSQIIINHVQARDGEKIDNVEQALDRAVANGVRNLVVQPTHLMHGAEYDELASAVNRYADKFESVSIAEPLLGEVGSDSSVVNDDKQQVAEDVSAQAAADAGYDNLSTAAQDGTAFVFLGHGTSHTANVTYDQMQTQMNDLGYENVFIGTVEGKPADTASEAVMAKASDAGYSHVVLRPLMVVAGDHANNDMAGSEEDSWLTQFEDSGAFSSVSCQVAGLGEIPAIQQIYVRHTADAISGLGAAALSGTDKASELADGTYTARFDTDSSMFHVNEANNGMGTLTVSNGSMTIHVSLATKNITTLFEGSAADAEKPGAQTISPTIDTVTYADGTTDEVYGFDVPVPALDKPFNVAILGSKGTWYDHQVTVSDPQPISEE